MCDYLCRLSYNNLFKILNFRPKSIGPERLGYHFRKPTQEPETRAQADESILKPLNHNTGFVNNKNLGFSLNRPYRPSIGEETSRS